MKSSLTKTKLKKLLSAMDRSALEALVLELYESEAGKELLTLHFDADAEAELLAGYEKKLRKVLAPANPERMSLDAADSILAEVKRLSGADSAVYARACLCAAELARDFTECYGDMDEHFYDRLARYYGEAARVAKGRPELEAELRERFRNLNASFASMGWGMGSVVDPELE